MSNPTQQSNASCLTTRVALGHVVATPGALEALAPYPGRLMDLMRRHASGDWGAVCEADRRVNDQALRDGDRLLSAYPIDETKPSKGHGENTVWIITEWDRSVTTALLARLGGFAGCEATK